MSYKPLDTQVYTKAVLDKLYKDRDFFASDQDNIELRRLIKSINNELIQPLYLLPSNPVDLVVNIGNIFVTNPETGVRRTVSPITNIIPNFSGGAVTFPSTSGGNAVPSVGDPLEITISANNYLKVGLFLDGAGNIVMQAGSEGVSESAATNPPTIPSTHSIGYVLLQDIAGTIQNIDFTSLVIYEGSGGGSGSGDATTIGDFIQDYHNESPYRLASSAVFSRDQGDILDVASTSAYSLVTGTVQFSASSQTLITNNLLDLDALDDDGLSDVGEIDLLFFWNEDAIDIAATYEVSRDGGNEYQVFTPEQLGETGTYRANHKFDTEAADQSLASQATNDADQELNNSTQAYISSKFTAANDGVLKAVDLDFNKNGAPPGGLYVAIYSDSAGDPDELISESAVVSASSITNGTNEIKLPDTVLEAGDYHVVVRTDGTYQAGFVASTTSLELGSNSAGTDGRVSADASSWGAGAGFDLVYDVKGRDLDLKVKVTSSAADVELEALSVHYELSPGAVVSGAKEVHTEEFLSDTDNFNEFMLPFLPDPDALKVYYKQTGQVFVHDSQNAGFNINGFTVSFPVGTFFKSPDEVVKLVFDQTQGSGFDTSDDNANKIATLEQLTARYRVVASAETLSSTKDWILADTFSGAFAIDLPANPLVGDSVVIMDAEGTFLSNNLTVGRNGNNINSAASDEVLIADDDWVEFIYVSPTRGWITRRK